MDRYVLLALVALLIFGHGFLSTETASDAARRRSLEAQLLKPTFYSLRGEPYGGFGPGFDGYPGVPDEMARGIPELMLLLRGNLLYSEGKVDAALSCWKLVIKKHLDTPASNMAVLNTAVTLKSRKKHAATIVILEQLLRQAEGYRLVNGVVQPVEGKPAKSVDEYLRRGMNNDWHEACAAISACHEALGHLPAARTYTVLARDKHVFRGGFCAGPAIQNYISLTERIARLDRMIEAKAMHVANKR